MVKAKLGGISKREQAEALAADALGFLAADPERLSRFLALSGIDPARIREAAGAAGFLAGVLDHLLADETLLVAFAAERSIAPEAIGRARILLGGAVPP